MKSALTDFYSQSRGQCLIDSLRDAPTGPPSERMLQSIWQHQRLHRDILETTDGRPLCVLHPGFWNYEAGPDFQRAVIKVGSDEPVSGDVEVDPRATDWHSHGHDTNPAFNGVILHVIWNGPAKTSLPTVRLQSHCDASLKELTAWYAAEPPFPVELAGQCRAPLAELKIDVLNDLLRQAAIVRMRAKAGSLSSIAQRRGWDAALWHGMFRALGYKHNTWPMQNLAERLPVMNCSGSTDAIGWLARLLGVAGLLTDDLPTQSLAARKYLRRLWDHWWRERDVFVDYQLTKSIWHFSGLRPANHPIRRLSLLAHWLARGDISARLKTWMETDCPKTHLATTLTELLLVQPDEFWKWHWTFRSPRQTKPCSLLGAMRVTDLAINVILPWFYARALAGKNRDLLRRIENRYTSWPPGQDNSVMKLARQRLFASTHRMPTAAHQQGLLQIVSDFCDHAPATCDDCQFPNLIRSWRL